MVADDGGGTFVPIVSLRFGANFIADFFSAVVGKLLAASAAVLAAPRIGIDALVVFQRAELFANAVLCL